MALPVLHGVAANGLTCVWRQRTVMTFHPPTYELSEHFAQLLQGRRLVAAVFFTFRYDPGFFEQQILPVFFDLPFRHSEAARAAQLGDAIRVQGVEIAVYYDAGGLARSDATAPRVNVSAMPVRHSRGVFHPKNVL